MQRVSALNRLQKTVPQPLQPYPQMEPMVLEAFGKKIISVMVLVEASATQILQQPLISIPRVH